MKWYEIIFGIAVWLMCLIVVGKIKDDYYGYDHKRKRKRKK